MKTIDDILKVLREYYEEQSPFMTGEQSEGFLSAVGIIEQMKEESK